MTYRGYFSPSTHVDPKSPYLLSHLLRLFISGTRGSWEESASVPLTSLGHVAGRVFTPGMRTPREDRCSML